MEVKIFNLNSDRGIVSYTIDKDKTVKEEFQRLRIILNDDSDFEIRHEETSQVLNSEFSFSNQNINENDTLLISFSIKGHSEEIGMQIEENDRPTLEDIASERGTKLKYKAKVIEAAGLRKIIEQKDSEVNQLKTEKSLLEYDLKAKKRNQIFGSIILVFAQIITAIGVNYYTGDGTEESLGKWLIGGGILFNLYGLYRVNE